MVKEKNLPDSLAPFTNNGGQGTLHPGRPPNTESEEITGTGKIKERRVPVPLGADRPGFFLTAPGY